MDLFQYGATWLKVDFHLHTKADKEFTYSGEVNEYCSTYVKALKDGGIHVGVITNHNKFDLGEFKALRKVAHKQDIFLLPGVELSVHDGANSIHTLIIFSDDWLKNGDYINQFLSVAFEGKTAMEYENGNGRSSLHLIHTIQKLEHYQKDFFLIFAHVEQKNGLWHELSGGRLQELGKDEFFKRRTLGFQKVRTHDAPDKNCRVKVKQWLGGWYPAEVEGSDPKNIEEIKEKDSCYLKLGAPTFEAVKFALIHHKSRLCLDTPPKQMHSYIKQIHFEGGILHGQTIYFSPELNTLIGIRGSGKSSILEALRYVLGIQVEVSDNDFEYKQKLVERTLDGGGKIVLDAIDRHGQAYQVRRIWKENATVFLDGKLQPGVSIRETVLNKPLFFGQKELAAAGKDSEKALIEKLLETKCNEIRRQITEQIIRVTDVIDQLSQVGNVEEFIEEQTRIKQDAEHRLTFYKKHNLEEKLQIRLEFEGNLRKVEKGVDLIETFIADIEELLAKHEDELRNFPSDSSANNAAFFKDFDAHFSKSIQSLDIIKAELEKNEGSLVALKKEHEKCIDAKEDLAEEFAAVERRLSEELKTSNGQSSSTSEFLAVKQKLASAESSLSMLLKSSNQKTALQDELNEELHKLNELWYKEFQIMKTELDEISNKNSALNFSLDFKEDKETFLDFFHHIFRGSGVHETTFQKIGEHYQDFIEIYRDFENAKKLFGKNPETFASIFEKNLKTVLTYQTPNKCTITYHGTKLVHHSLGQRASALILFVLRQREHDIIIIDQPEDDLDNQTIYEDVIKFIRELKPSVQFIFATHNPNFPVLGDAEQIHGCSFVDGRIHLQSGGIDDSEQQKKIVNIMEGGKEAFTRRKEIYQAWKS